MISRHWTGLCKKEKAYTYIQYLQSATFPALQNIEGFIRASILHRETTEGVEFLIITTWQSMEAIKEFSGDHYEIAVVPAVVQEMMINYEQSVKYFKTIE